MSALGGIETLLGDGENRYWRIDGEDDGLVSKVIVDVKVCVG
jgi:hypothetical protein